MALVRILINAIVLVVIALVVPFVRFVDPSLLSIVLLAVALGVLNALVKPVLQFVFLPLIFFSKTRLAMWMHDFGVVICLALVSSMLVAVTLIPLSASRILTG